MIFATFIWQVAEHQAIRWKAYLPEVLFYQSYQPDRLWAHTWSLAVEEHFYIFLPLLLLLILKIQRNRNSADPFRVIPLICAILAAGCFLQRFYQAQASPDLQVSWGSILFPTHLRIDSLFFGVLLGYLYHFHESAMKQMTASRLRRFVLLVASALLASTCMFFPPGSVFMLSFGLTALYIGFGGILVLAVYPYPGGPRRLSTWLNQVKVGDVAAHIGMYSYSIYLWHAMVTQHYQGFLRLIWPGIGEAALFWGYVLISLAGGIVLSRLIEYPVLHVRDRLFPSPDRVGSEAGLESR